MKQIIDNRIGRRIYREMLRKQITVSEFAKAINYSRPNIYNIAERTSLDCTLLYKISVALKHNFFKDLAIELEEEITHTSTL